MMLLVICRTCICLCMFVLFCWGRTDASNSTIHELLKPLIPPGSKIRDFFRSSIIPGKFFTVSPSPLPPPTPPPSPNPQPPAPTPSPIPPGIQGKVDLGGACNSNPCENGRICVSDTSIPGGYLCACVSGYIGVNCGGQGNTTASSSSEEDLGADWLFSLPKPRDGCPSKDKFTKSWLHLPFGGFDNSLAELDSNVTDLSLCRLSELRKIELPHGEYCVLSIDADCPRHLKTGLVSINKDDSKNLEIRYCCHGDNDYEDPVTFPWSDAFYLIPMVKGHCQTIEDFDKSSLFLHWRVRSSQALSYTITTPGSYRNMSMVSSKDNGILFHLCYYEPNDSGSIIKSIIIAASVCGPVLLFTVLWVCCRKRRQLKRKEKGHRNRTREQTAPSTDIKFIEEDTTVPSQKQIMPLQIGSVLKIILDQESQWKIHGLLLHPNKLETSDKVGQGAFGTVYKGHYRPDSNPMNCKEVAVKTLKDTCVYPEITAFMEEAIVMSDFRHMNVLSIIGVCIRLDTEIPMIVLPYMALGDLQHYCRQFRYDDKMKNKVPELPQLLSFSLQIARGMDYLAGLKFVHRDLATRNCMLDRDMVVKVADFGLTRDVYSNSYYRQDKQKLLPIKWMALESLQDRVFTTYTDVWSYGVTIWEIFTLAKVPYPELENYQIVEALGKGARLLRPNSCPENVYEVIEKCWNENPKERPSFAKICQELEKVLSQFSEYLDLEESPKAVSEPTIDPVQNLSETNDSVLQQTSSYQDYRDVDKPNIDD